MDAAFWFEVIGYGASGLIALSILQQSILRLRIIGLVGSVVFVAYGLLIAAYPVALVNAVIAGIHVVSLRRLVRRGDEKISFLPVEGHHAYLERFLDFHAADVDRYFPDGLDLGESEVAVFLLRDLVPAGLFVARPEGPDLVVEVDYVIPRYRDLVLGRYLFDHLDQLVDLDSIERVVTGPAVPEHERYLSTVGFEPDGSGGWFRPV